MRVYTNKKVINSCIENITINSIFNLLICRPYSMGFLFDEDCMVAFNCLNSTTLNFANLMDCLIGNHTTFPYIFFYIKLIQSHFNIQNVLKYS